MAPNNPTRPVKPIRSTNERKPQREKADVVKDVVLDLANLTSLDPDEIDAAVQQIAATEGQESVDEALMEIEEAKKIPSGEGLTKKEAEQLLVETINKSLQLKNQKALAKFKVQTDAWIEELRAGRRGKRREPKHPILLPTYTARHIDQVVNIARHRLGYESLLEAAGHAPLRKRQ